MGFGKNLQFLRHLRGNMTQAELAEKMDVSRQTVSKWELDTAQPEMDKAAAIPVQVSPAPGAEPGFVRQIGRAHV